jgi:hypothetical protein
MTPFTGKLLWIVPITGGLFIMGAIISHYRAEKTELAMFLGAIGLGILGLHLMMWKHRRDKAAREGDARPLKSPGER